MFICSLLTTSTHSPPQPSPLRSDLHHLRRLLLSLPPRLRARRRPFAFNIHHDDLDALNHTAHRNPCYARLFRELHDDSRDFLLANVAYLLSGLAVASATQLVAVFAAVVTYSGEETHTFAAETHTFAALLRKVQAHLKGLVLTLAFAYALQITSVVVLLTLAALFIFLAFKRYLGLLLAESVVFLVAYVMYVYLSFVCSLGVVVSVAEPGRHGRGAVWQTWRMVKESLGRAMLIVSVTGVLVVLFSPFYWLTKICALNKMVSGELLLGFVYAVLMAAVEVFGVCTMTAFYYEFTDRAQQEPEMKYVKLPVQDV